MTVFWRFLGIFSPLAGLLSFCILGNLARSMKDEALEARLVLLVFALLFGSFIWMTFALKAEEKDGRLSVAWKRKKERLRQRWHPLIFGQPGPTDIVVSRTPDAAVLRMPDESPLHPWPMDLLVTLMFFGSVGEGLLISAIVSEISKTREFFPWMAVTPSLIPLVILLVYLRIRFTWYYELTLRPAELSADFRAFGLRWRTYRTDLTQIRQFTVVQKPSLSLLLAESVEDKPRLILGRKETAVLLRLAQILAEEGKRLVPQRIVVRVSHEIPDAPGRKERQEPPLNSRVVMTRHGTAITLDFPVTRPLPGSRQEQVRNHYLSAIVLMVLACSCWGISLWAERDLGHDGNGFGVMGAILTFLGIVTAVTARYQTWSQPPQDERLHQLAVAGNLLIRTSCDNRKQLWYRQEIRGLDIEQYVETHEQSSEGGSSTTSIFHLHLVVQLYNGEKAILLNKTSLYPHHDYREKAELEWIATQLRQALPMEEADAVPVTLAATRNPLTEHVQDKSGYRGEI